jgi:pilus assembly protein CpaF
MALLTFKRAIFDSYDSIPDHVDRRELLFQRLKVAIHEELVESLELTMLAQVKEAELSSEVRAVAQELLREHAVELKGHDQERFLKDLLEEVFGLGPLEKLVEDDAISDILVNSPYEVYIERRGRLEQTDVIFADNAHLMRIIHRVVSRVGRRIDEVSPMVDARLPDGSRVNAVIPPLALNGPTLSIRRFGKRPLTLDDLTQFQSIAPEMVQFLAAAIESRASFLIAGGTGAGKTTLLNALTKFIPAEERLITIEDSAELNLLHRHVIRLETRPPNTEDTGEVTQRALVRNSLRMRPDRIIVGEVRGSEALDMLQAMNTGHEGSLTTIHANDTRDALARLEMMVAMTGYELPVPVVREYIATGIRLVVHLARLKGGARRVMRISEVVGIKDGMYQLEDIFGYEQTGVQDGQAVGEYYVTGYRPACLKRFQAAGIELPDALFEARKLECGKMPDPANSDTKATFFKA